MAKKRETIDPALHDELLVGRDPKTVLSSQGPLGELQKALAERILNAEMDQHLEAPEEQEAGNLEQVIPFFAFPTEVRRMIYTTNAIESLQSQVRKAVRGRGYFPSDDSATKLIWLVLRNIQEKGIRPPVAWHKAMSQFAIHFQNRFVVNI